MVDQFNRGVSTIRKYVNLVCDVLIDKDKLFNKYINIFLGQRLKDIILCFEKFIGVPNICEAIDGTHIPLVDLLSKRVTLAIGDFFNRKSYIVLCCKLCVMHTKSFGMFMLANLEGYMMVASFKGVIYMHNWGLEIFSKN